MLRILKAFIAVGGWLGLIYLPADLVGLPETYPFLNRLSDMNRETLLIWFSGLLVAYLLFVELRPYLRNYREGRAFLGLEDAGRYYRDLLVRHDMNDAVKIFDSMSSPHQDQPTSSPVASAFRWVAQEGVNDGVMEVWGVPENGSKPARLKDVEDDGLAHRRFLEGDPLFLMMDGVYYLDLKVKRSTIETYAKCVMRNDVQKKTFTEDIKTKVEDRSNQERTDIEEETLR